MITLSKELLRKGQTSLDAVVVIGYNRHIDGLDEEIVEGIW